MFSLFLSLIFALLTMFSYGVIDFVSYIIAKKASSVRIVLWSSILGSIPLSVGLFFFTLPSISQFDLFLIVVASFSSMIALVSLYEGLKVGKVSVVIPVSGTWSVITFIIGIFVLKELLGSLQIYGVILTIFGTSIVSLKLHDLTNLKFTKLVSGAEYALVAMVAWGFQFSIIGFLSKELGWYWPIFTTSVATMVMLFVYSIANKIELSMPFKISKELLFYAALGSLGFLFYAISSAYGYISIAGPIAASSPLITVAMAMFLLKEKVEKIQVLGIASILLGLVLIAY